MASACAAALATPGTPASTPAASALGAATTSIVRRPSRVSSAIGPLRDDPAAVDDGGDVARLFDLVEQVRG